MTGQPPGPEGETAGFTECSPLPVHEQAMPAHPSSSPAIARRFGLRDVWAYSRAMPRLAGPHKPKFPLTALARISAMDLRDLPPSRRFAASDGAELAYRTYPGPAEIQLLLVHGSGCFGDQLHFLASRLAQGGKATVHTLDMRGHGQSPPMGRDHDCFARDVGEFAAHLKSLPGNPTVIVGGHSAGGGIVLNVARTPYASAVSGWLLLSPFIRIDSDSVRPYFGGWMPDISRFRFAMTALADMLGITRFNGGIVLGFDRETCNHDPRFTREWPFTAAFGFGPGPIPDRAHRRISPRQPVLLISGGRDECFIPERYEAALARIAIHGGVRILDGLGHWDILVDDQTLGLCSQWIDENFAKSPRESGDYVRTVRA